MLKEYFQGYFPSKSANWAHITRFSNRSSTASYCINEMAIKGIEKTGIMISKEKSSFEVHFLRLRMHVNGSYVGTPSLIRRFGTSISKDVISPGSQQQGWGSFERYPVGRNSGP
jgi:hypothetical protein